MSDKEDEKKFKFKQQEKLVEDIDFPEDIEIDEKIEDIIVVKDVTKDFPIGDFIVRAVDNVSLNIKENEFVVIRGPSGAGKTTLLNLIGALDSPDKGEIYFYGVKISDLNQESLTIFRLMNSGFIFQNYNLISTLSAEENVMFPVSLRGENLEKQREIAVELLKKVGLGERREHLPFQLSAGEQQRVAIARALANDPPVILADEPTANLDKHTSEFIRDFFIELKEGDKTIIIASHDDYLIDLADKVINFDEGKIILDKIRNY
ncbi:MAG: ABC transporter ATP-binding protein [Candidatus Lokiarchaeota archaeon]